MSSIGTDILNTQAQFAVDRAKLLNNKNAHKTDGNKIAASGGSFVDTSRLNTQENLDEALEKFEAIFVRMMFKSAQKATESVEEGLFSNSGLKQFRSMHYDELADNFAKSSNLGIAEALKRQLLNNNPTPNTSGQKGLKSADDLVGMKLDGAELKQKFMQLVQDDGYMDIKESDTLKLNRFMDLKNPKDDDFMSLK